MTLPLLRLVAASTDDDDYDRLIEARGAEVEAHCPHGLDVDDCGRCWIEDDTRQRRAEDR